MTGISIRSRAPKAGSEKIRLNMQANYGGELKPEKALRSALHKAGLRFNKHQRPLPTLRCVADIVFSRRKLCIFVDGCFWHGCPLHFKSPKTNAAWWEEKISSTRLRDELQTEALRSAGWRIFRFWEHEILESLPTLVELIRGEATHCSQ